jgi:hypothetical protein
LRFRTKGIRLGTRRFGTEYAKTVEAHAEGVLEHLARR